MVKIDEHDWNLNTVSKILDGEKIEIDPKIKAKVSKNRDYLANKMMHSDDAIYGINTGFGSLCDIKIPKKSINQLQLNLVRSHACGTGPEVPEKIVRLIQALKIKNLSFGNSGVRLELVDHMTQVFNAEIRPEMFQQGSLGASGDLAPLSHLAIMLIGEGNAYINQEKIPSLLALDQKKITPIFLEAKEGLALLNGTQFSTSYLAYACLHAEKLFKLANLITALSYEAYWCSLDPLDPQIHKARNQKGQISTATNIREILKDSFLKNRTANYVQDPYAFRCVPQVHGASKDVIDYCTLIVTNEINAVTDNPLIFDDSETILSGGNFHAQPIALANDFLAIALAEIGSISERRIFNLIDGKRDLPSYLVKDQGINSGFMIAQYTAAAIVSENKQLCTPASIDSITSSKGQEDHVSMAANAGRKLYTVVDNLYQILAIELLTASQAIDFRNVNECSSYTLKLYAEVRSKVNFVDQDIVLGEQMRNLKVWIKDGGLNSLLH